MLILMETPAGYGLFKVLKKGKLKNVDNIHTEFESPEAAGQMVKLKAFCKFEDTAEALAAASAICDGKLDKKLKKFLKTSIVNKELKDKLGVCDAKLGGLIKKKVSVECVCDKTVLELIRGVRSQLEALVGGIQAKDLQAMKLGLSHSLCRYKLKFSPDKVDTMIIQAISLLDELDKELNTYAMRVREWYGWHFPEMGKIVTDNLQYARVVHKMGQRLNCASTDLSDILEEDTETDLKEASEVSMGAEMADEDIDHVKQLTVQVTTISEYRTSLFDYLKQRMNAIAPNLSVMVGELVGARLVAHAGSLMNLAKAPASTVQIFGAEKALFRALKTKHDTPKYGLIYHASLVGQAQPKHKGKISRVLAAKTALSVRMDALGDTEGVTIGFENRAKVEHRLKELEAGKMFKMSGTAKGKAKQESYDKKAAGGYSATEDVVMGDAEEKVKKEKKKKKKKKKEKEVKEEPETGKKRKRYFDGEEGAEEEGKKKKKKKKQKTGDEEKKKKKKKKSKKE